MDLCTRTDQWYKAFLRCLAPHCRPTTLPVPPPTVSPADMRRLVRQVTPRGGFSLAVEQGRISALSDVLGCLLHDPDCDLRRPHLRLCIVGPHWVAVLVHRTPHGGIGVHVYHPGSYRELRKANGVHYHGAAELRILGACYQTDDTLDQCAAYALWCTFYIPRFLAAEGAPPGHVPWFQDPDDAADVNAACARYISGRQNASVGGGQFFAGHF